MYGMYYVGNQYSYINTTLLEAFNQKNVTVQFLITVDPTI